MRGMAKVTSGNLVRMANIRSHEAMSGSMGHSHELQSRKYSEGSRGHEFHSAASRANYDQADRSMIRQQQSVGIKAENVRTSKARKKSPFGNQGGRFN